VAEPATRAATLNADAQSSMLDRAALNAAIGAQSVAFQKVISVGHEHLFADVPVFISSDQLRKMYEVIAAVEQVVNLPGWQAPGDATPEARGVCFGYDFHLNEQGVHLIEINTNAGGAFLNELLFGSQRDVDLPGKTVVVENLESTLLAMFRNEWRLARGSAPFRNTVVVDEQPEKQYLYPEFLLVQRMLQQEEIVVFITDPVALHGSGDGLYFGKEKIDMVYNRLTDFSLQQHPALLQAYTNGQVVLTPHPHAYAKYADKRNLARLTDAQGLRELGADEADIATLLEGIPHTIRVDASMEAVLWQERKNLFFKPAEGYGSKGTYRGDKLTKRVFGEIMQGDYVAQRLALPGERAVSVGDSGSSLLKYDVRCYAYEGQMQLVAARLYQGQTTNFRTPGGGFAPVRVVE